MTDIEDEDLTNQIEEDDLDDDDHDWIDDDFDDGSFPERIKNEYPGFYLIRIFRYNATILREMDEWLKENITNGTYKRVGWSSGCSTSIGVVIEHPSDAMYYKLWWA